MRPSTQLTSKFPPETASLANLLNLARTIHSRWARVSLASLLLQSEREPSGIAVEAIRADGFPRAGILVGVSGIDRIGQLAPLVGLDASAASPDFARLSLFDLFLQSVQTRRLACAWQCNPAGEPVALAIAAAWLPEIERLEAVLDIEVKAVELAA